MSYLDNKEIYRDYLMGVLLLHKMSLFEISKGHRFTYDGKPMTTIQINVDEYLRRIVVILHKNVR